MSSDSPVIVPPRPVSSPPRLAVLISGGGTTLVNLQQKIQQGQLNAVIPLVIASRECGGIDRARELGINPILLNRKSFPGTEAYSDEVFRLCREHQIDLVVLGGFLTKIVIPDDFQFRVVNIHPALIPSFSGKGMFGHHVHQAVLDRGCQFSGCTVHFCDNEYDHGPIILQRVVPVLPNDNADTLAARVFTAECDVYPEALTMVLEGRLEVQGQRVRQRADSLSSNQLS
jgi:phosphoribosylglycinamide formyltransferase-1